MELPCKWCGVIIDSDEHREGDIVFCSLRCAYDFDNLQAALAEDWCDDEETMH